jgi:F-type H+-transporting ATPase subunit a
MGEVQITTDDTIFWQAGWLKLNATILYTWLVMALLVGVSAWTRSGITSGTRIPPLQNLLEVIVDAIRKQIREVSGEDSRRYIAFIGTLFLFIAMSTLLGLVPGLRPPTASLSTTAALAACVLFAVPWYGIRKSGFRQYLGQYLKPTFLMLPFNIIGELSRTLALAIRLYGNMMSGAVIAVVLLAFVPLLAPVVMQMLGLITGMVQAYIFAVLAMVYIASATRARQRRDAAQPPESPPDAAAEAP